MSIQFDNTAAGVVTLKPGASGSYSMTMPISNAVGVFTNDGSGNMSFGVGIFPAGTAAAPAITTTGDTNNGIFFPSADVVAITTNGSERVRVDSTGNFLVGTTSGTFSGQPINGVGVAGAGGALLALNNSYNTNQSWHHWIYDSGLGAAGTYSIGQVINGSTSGVAGGPFTPIINMAVPSAASNSPKVFINASGNLGIGTTSPAYKLDVNGDINVPSDSSYFLGANADRYIKYRSSQNDVLYSSFSGLFYQQAIASTYHAWFTGNNERMRIDSSGNLFLNCTSTPTTNSTAIINAVASGDGINLKQTSNGNNMFNLWQTGTTTYAAITFNKVCPAIILANNRTGKLTNRNE
jgi:hypothetical protein